MEEDYYFKGTADPDDWPDRPYEQMGDYFVSHGDPQPLEVTGDNVDNEEFGCYGPLDQVVFAACDYFQKEAYYSLASKYIRGSFTFDSEGVKGGELTIKRCVFNASDGSAQGEYHKITIADKEETVSPGDNVYVVADEDASPPTGEIVISTEDVPDGKRKSDGKTYKIIGFMADSGRAEYKHIGNVAHDYTGGYSGPFAIHYTSLFTVDIDGGNVLLGDDSIPIDSTTGLTVADEDIIYLKIDKADTSNYEFIAEAPGYSPDRTTYYFFLIGTVKFDTGSEEICIPCQGQHGDIQGGGGSDVRLAKITSGAGRTYTADIYSNMDQAAIETGVTVKVLENHISASGDIPNDTVLSVRQHLHGGAGTETSAAAQCSTRERLNSSRARPFNIPTPSVETQSPDHAVGTVGV